jgi:hypothetical protein
MVTASAPKALNTNKSSSAKAFIGYPFVSKILFCAF